jgi:stalled ribosome rescue protein Dom34
MHSYFDQIGFGCLTRREQRECESNIVELNEQLANAEVVDEIDINQIQSQTNSQRKVEQSKSSIMAKFIHSIGKKLAAPSSSSVITSNKKKLMEEISEYRSLAQREYNSIVHDEKYPNAVCFMRFFKF